MTVVDSERQAGATVAVVRHADGTDTACQAGTVGEHTVVVVPAGTVLGVGDEIRVTGTADTVVIVPGAEPGASV